uniref:Uncharacterized protein n=1 Tax=Microviridae sp. ctoGr7 TaxID=2827649 RepID=A0A8S5SYP6_9VIRU|nr:MAG TPA: hypothetical protein [Microviridae sp. ctoGr7]
MCTVANIVIFFLFLFILYLNVLFFKLHKNTFKRNIS